MAQAGYHPDFVASLHHLLHAQGMAASKSLYAMHPCWEERDKELTRAYTDASIEFEHLWREWYSSPRRESSCRRLRKPADLEEGLRRTITDSSPDALRQSRRRCRSSAAIRPAAERNDAPDQTARKLWRHTRDAATDWLHVSNNYSHLLAEDPYERPTAIDLDRPLRHRRLGINTRARRCTAISMIRLHCTASSEPLIH